MQYKLEITESIIRAFTGILFLFQGYDKIFRIRLNGVIETFQDEAEHHHIPRPWVSIMVYYTSFVEFIGGLLLILGLFTNYSLIALGLDMALVALAFSIMNPVWDLSHVFPRLILIATLLIMPDEWNKFSLDFLFPAK
ncbi:MAG: DoxX family membrane protein [Bacteroidia bacterium]